MYTVNLQELPLTSSWTKDVPSQRVQSTFPFLGSGENQNVSVVYFELEPGDQLGTHTDSAEEVLFIVEGKVEVTVGDEQAIVEAPSLALVPTLVPHNLRNVGEVKVKVAGFFPVRDTVSVFEQAWLPDETNVIDTAQIAASLA